MLHEFLKQVREWNEISSERVKLQYGYIVFAVLTIFIAGLLGLVNYDLGQRLTSVALISLGVFLINLIAWTLLKGLVIDKISKPDTKKSTKSPTKTHK